MKKPGRARWLTLLAAIAMMHLACADARSSHPEVPASAAHGDATHAIGAMLDDFHDAAAKADESRYFAHLAEDSIFLGTDATERWNKKAFLVFAHPHFAKGKAWSFHSIRRDIVIDGEGAAHFDEDLATEKLGPARGSGVVAFRSGAWVVVQYNLALTIPNERFGEAHRAVSAVLLDPDVGPLAPYAWLSGDWVSETNGERTEELWSEPRGGTMIGMARTIRDGKTTFFEALRIEARPSGLALIAKPSGQAEAEFSMAAPSQTDATILRFENAGHDFPQRIEYRKSGDELVAHIEGGGPASDWHYRRAVVAAH